MCQGLGLFLEGVFGLCAPHDTLGPHDAKSADVFCSGLKGWRAQGTWTELSGSLSGRIACGNDIKYRAVGVLMHPKI